jgi:phage antirepressor YoqD-like protein
MTNLQERDTFTSLELTELINQYRNEEGNKNPLRHDNLLQIIRDEFEEEISLLKIQESNYKNDRGKEYPMFVLNLAQSRQVLVRESKFVRKSVISYIDKLENSLINKLPKDYPSALRALADKAEETQRLLIANKVKDQQISELKPKADYVDKILKSKSLMNINQIAKDYGMSGIALNRILYKLGIQYKQGRQWLLYSKYHSKGYTHSETIEIPSTCGTPRLELHTKWTQKGRLFLYEILKDNQIVPLIEKVQ